MDINTAIYENGQFLWDGQTLYHPNGGLAWRNGMAFYLNEQVAYVGNKAFHLNGEIAWDGKIGLDFDGTFLSNFGIALPLNKLLWLKVDKKYITAVFQRELDIVVKVL